MGEKTNQHSWELLHSRPELRIKRSISKWHYFALGVIITYTLIAFFQIADGYLSMINPAKPKKVGLENLGAAIAFGIIQFVPMAYFVSYLCPIIGLIGIAMATYRRDRRHLWISHLYLGLWLINSIRIVVISLLLTKSP